jgi:hypothetical protein
LVLYVEKTKYVDSVLEEGAEENIFFNGERKKLDAGVHE